MSNSRLTMYTKLSPNMNSPRVGKIRKITIHHVAGVGTIESLGALFALSERKASSNYGVGNDGRIGLYVDEANRAWTSDSYENDHMAVTIEVFNSRVDSNWPVSDRALNATIDLCVDICIRNGINNLTFTGDAQGNLTLHKFFAPTGCPGPYLESKMPYIASTVNKRLKECEVISAAVERAAKTLYVSNIINSPDYWVKNYQCIRYLGELIVKLGGAPKSEVCAEEEYDVRTAISILDAKGVIDTPNYWLSNYHRMQYLEELLINTSKRL